jgi:hypothetical protein
MTAAPLTPAARSTPAAGASPVAVAREQVPPRTFALTLFDPPVVRPGGSPDAADGVVWPVFGRRSSGDLAALLRLFTMPVPGAGKFACPFVTACTFTDDRRTNAGFERASLVALDVENGVTTREAHARFAAFTHAIYTTWRHTPEAHRFRLVLPLARDVDAREYKLLWAVLARRLGAGADPQTKDLARALFLPAVRPDGGRAAAKAWEDAPVLDPDALLVEALALVRPEALPRPRRPLTVQVLPMDAARRLARRRLAEEPEARQRAAQHLGARLVGRRAEGVPCPQCARPSVWFWLEPGRMGGARCNHRNSCGWDGPLDVLLDVREVGGG